MHFADKHPHPPNWSTDLYWVPFAIYQNNIMSSRLSCHGIILLVGLVIASIGNEDLV